MHNANKFPKLSFYLQTELNCLSRIGSKLQYADLRFEPLDISTDVALKMFSDNR